MEPLTDFSRDDARAGDAGRAERGRRTARPHLSAGHRRPARCRRPRRSTRSIRRTQRQVVGQLRPGRRWSRRSRRSRRRRRRFPAWRDTQPARTSRAACSARRTVMRRRRFELAAWQVYECGKPWREADADVAEAIDFCDYYAREMLRLAEPRHRNVPGEDNAYFYEPRGVAVVIAPWNFPLAILCGMTTAALVTGNTVVMKPAEQSSVIGAKLMEVFQEAGLPPGVVNYLPGVGEEIGPTLVSHPDVALIAFTGSRGVGLRDQPRRRPRCLRGPGPRQARHRRDGRQERDHRRRRRRPRRGGPRRRLAAPSATQGQKCSACCRVIVLEALYDAFLDRLVEATRSLKVAPAEDPGCARRPGHRRRGAPAHPATTIERANGEAQAGLRRRRRAAGGRRAITSAPHIFADVSPTVDAGPGRDLRPGAGGAEGARSDARAGDRQRHELRADRRPLSRAARRTSRG